LTHQVGWDSHDALARCYERDLKMVRNVPAVLQRPHNFWVEFARLGERLTVACVVSGDLAFAAQLARAGVDGGEGVGALVGIRSDHDHVVVPSVECRLEWISGGQF
jgi:hypothetical protein